MDIIETLKMEHRRVMAIFQQFETTDSLDAKTELLVQLAQELSVHEQAEEEAVWFPLRQLLPDASVVEDAIGEEDGLKALLEALVLSLDDEQVLAGMKQLKQLLVTHIQTEEAKIVPLVTAHVNETKRQQLAEAYGASKNYQVSQMARLNIIMAPEAPIEQRLGTER